MGKRKGWGAGVVAFTSRMERPNTPSEPPIHLRKASTPTTPRASFYFSTQGKREDCLRFTALHTTLVPPTRELASLTEPTARCVSFLIPGVP